MAISIGLEGNSKDGNASIHHTWLPIGTVKSLLSSHRHHITLRSKTKPVTYHSILLFHFDNYATSQQRNDSVTASASSPRKRSWYAMTAQCPHLGAPLESAPVRRVESDGEARARGDAGDDQDASSEISFEDEEEIEDAVIICPWHEYDFDLRTGESTTGMKACVYKVRTVGGALEDDGDNTTATVEIENMQREDDGRLSEWEVVEIRPVSEAFPSDEHKGRERAAESLHQAAMGLSLGEDDSPPLPATASSSVLPPEPRPKTLVAWACLVLNTANPARKVAYTRMAAEAFRTGDCKIIGGGRWDTGTDPPTWLSKPEETPPQTPPREEHIKTVRPGQEQQRRGKGGSVRSRVAMLHSLANIELWAIDLGWDILARSPHLFAQFQNEYNLTPTERKNRQLPLEFYNDFVKLSVDEAKHFSLLVDRLQTLDGTTFGDLEVHQGLWDTALQTSNSLTARLSIIHLVNEARGLDVNPVTIKKFEKAGDEESTRVLEIIHHDEITHVGIGNRHLHYLCSLPLPALNPVEVFREEVRRNFAGRLKGPFNVEDRKKAGLDREWYEDLVGMRNELKAGGANATTGGVAREEVAGG